MFLKALVLLCSVHLSVQNCAFNLDVHIPEPSPVMIDPRINNFIRTADTNGNVAMTTNQQLRFACPGSGNFIRVRGTGAQERVATCVTGQTFLMDGIQYNLNQLNCQAWPSSQHSTVGTCLGSRSLINVGFTLSIGFIPVLQVCHDTQTHRTHYTEFTMLRDVATRQRASGRVPWAAGPNHLFVGVNPDNLYTRFVQRQTVSTLLGSSARGDQFIHATNDFFMARGHLVAFGDHPFGAQQQATMVFVNAAPQWQTFNGGNWNSLEINIRALAGRLNRNLIVYTGTWGHDTLPNTSNVQTQISLAITGPRHQIPAPRYYWKVVRDPSTNLATAFIGTNNPYITLAVAQAGMFCTDISNTISWLSWRQFDIVLGYSFSCQIADFRRTVTDLPSFTTVGVLR